MEFIGADRNPIVAKAVGDPDGRLVLFLHGGGQTRHTWSGAQIALAERGFRSVALDARGHGESAWTTNTGYAIEAFAADLRQVAEMIGRPVAIVGASLGGLTAMVALGLYPDINCYALVLVDVVPRPSMAGVAHIIEFMAAHSDGFADPEAAADAVAGYRPGRPRPASTDGLRKNLRLANDGRYYWHWDPAFLIGRAQDGTHRSAMETTVRTTTIPTLLVRGRSSDVVTDEALAEFRELAPNVPVVDIRGAGHMLVGDQNDVFVDAIAQFLDSTQRA